MRTNMAQKKTTKLDGFDGNSRFDENEKYH